MKTYILSDNYYDYLYLKNNDIINKLYIYPIRNKNRYLITEEILDFSNNVNQNLDKIILNIDLFDVIKYSVLNNFKNCNIKIIKNSLLYNTFKINKNVITFNLNIKNNNINNFIVLKNSKLYLNDIIYDIYSYNKSFNHNYINFVLKSPTKTDIEKNSLFLIESLFMNKYVSNYNIDYNILGAYIEYKDSFNYYDLTTIYSNIISVLKNIDINNIPIQINNNLYSLFIDYEYNKVIDYIYNYFIYNLRFIYNDIIDIFSNIVEKIGQNYIFNIFNDNSVNNEIIFRIRKNYINNKFINNIITFKNIILYNYYDNIIFLNIEKYNYTNEYIEISCRIADFLAKNNFILDNSTLFSFQPQISFIPILSNNFISDNSLYSFLIMEFN